MIRILWVNNVKAISIFLVVLGHFSGLNPEIKNIVYSFHIPVFLFVTGFLISNIFNTFSVRNFLKKSIYPYVNAYVFFSMIAIAILYCVEGVSGSVSDALLPILRMVYGVHGADRALMHHNGPLWYFPFLITTLFVTYSFVRFPPWLGWVMALIYCSFSLLYSGVRLPWCVDKAGVGVLFCFIGYKVNTHYDDIFKHLIEGRLLLSLLPILFIILIVMVDINGATNINRAMFGNNGIVFLVNALIGCSCIVVISANIPKTILAQKISIHTMTIFCTHIYIVKAISKVVDIDGDLMSTILAFSLAIVVLSLCLLFSVTLTPLLNRYILRK